MIPDFSQNNLTQSKSLMSSTKIVVKKGLDAKPFINIIGKLLYDVYIEEGKWKFGSCTPSKLSVETDESGTNMMIDTFMKDEDLINQTIWVVISCSNFLKLIHYQDFPFKLALSEENEVIGCVRFIHGTQIELSGYESRSEAIQDFLGRHKGLKL